MTISMNIKKQIMKSLGKVLILLINIDKKPLIQFNQSQTTRYRITKNILNTYQSAFSRFLNDTSKSYWNNYMYPERYADVYNKTSQNITDNTINANRRINDLVLGSTETFNKSIEIAQKYYNESVQNYFNFVNKIEKSYYNH
jgi:hypothetical protein